MNKKIFYKILIFGIAILLIIFFLVINFKKPMICIENKKCFNVFLATNSETRQIGLSNYGSLDENFGMLFIFQEENIPSFWMKNMNFSIDLIWIDSDNKIIGFEKNMNKCLENCSLYYPDNLIKYAIEINSGLINKYNLKINDSVSFIRVKI